MLQKYCIGCSPVSVPAANLQVVGSEGSASLVFVDLY